MTETYERPQLSTYGGIDRITQHYDSYGGWDGGGGGDWGWG